MFHFYKKLTFLLKTYALDMVNPMSTSISISNDDIFVYKRKFVLIDNDVNYVEK